MGIVSKHLAAPLLGLSLLVVPVYAQDRKSISAAAHLLEQESQLAQLFADRLGRKEEAAAIYLALLAEGTETADVVEGLERLAAQGIRQADISRALSPYYAQKGDFHRQVGSLLVQVSSVEAVSEKKALPKQTCRTRCGAALTW